MRGRPTDYNDETLIKAQSYVDGGYLEMGHVVPSIVGLTKALNRSRSLINELSHITAHNYNYYATVDDQHVARVAQRHNLITSIFCSVACAALA